MTVNFRTSKARRMVAGVMCLTMLSGLASHAKETDEEQKDEVVTSENSDFFEVRIDKSTGAVAFPAMTVGMSNALSEESKRGALLGKKRWRHWWGVERKECPGLYETQANNPEAMPAVRKCLADAFRKTSLYRGVMARYPNVAIQEEMIGGVVTDVYLPENGVSRRNENRVLIHLHGGGGTYGSRWIGYLSATPIAATGDIKVVSVDYRQAPEVSHPTALEDIEAVYKELLKDYRPENIGLFGCSAGGYFTKVAVPWFHEKGLPTPGAVMIAGQGPGVGTDSIYFGLPFMGIDVDHEAIEALEETVLDGGYFKNVDPEIAFGYPDRHPALMADFPPTLVVSSTRDNNLSPSVYLHRQLVKQGVNAELHVWEGLEHCFQSKSFIPESQEYYDLTVEFFEKHLGTRSR